MSAVTYDYWSNALEGNFGPVHDGDAQPGFYRRRLVRNGPFVPVAIWHDGTKMIALVDGKPADPVDLWSWVCDKPITEQAYHKAVRGEGWDDEPEAPIAPTNGNMPSDPHEALSVEWDQEKEIGNGILAKPITTKEQADQAAVYAKRVAVVAKKATDHHKVEKQPALDEGRRVDDKWRDLKDEPADMGKKVKRHLDAFLREQERIEQERQRKAREEAERRQKEAEEAERKARQAGNDEAAQKEAARLKAEADEAECDAQARNASAGRTGSKVALRTFVSAEITDFDALLLALKDRPEIRECVETLANRAARSGVDLPGMKRIEEKRAA